ncbi:MAG: hypothetical protein AB8G22_23010, partial [Saprospiraceae bacterium]
SYEKSSGSTQPPGNNSGSVSTGTGASNSKVPTRKSYSVDATARITTITTQLQQFANGQRPTNWKPSRFLYKVGSLRIANATPFLQTIATNPQFRTLHAEDDFRYSLVYALARCGDQSVLNNIDQLVNEAESPTMKRLTLDTFMNLATTEMKAKIQPQLTQVLPTNLADILAKEQPTEEDLIPLFPTEINSATPPLFVLYLLNQEHPEYRNFVLKAVHNLPFTYPYFQSLRYIYKSAEFRDDFEVLGILAQRFDSENYNFQTKIRWSWNSTNQTYSSKRIREEKKAFSNRTKAYFQRRVVRQIQLLGEQEQEAYCQYATAILNQYTDENSTPKVERQSSWAYDNRRWRETVRQTIAFQQFVLAIITQNTDNESVNKNTKTNKVSFQQQYFQQNREQRTEPFQQLWNQHPQYALEILIHCQSDYVAHFSIKILREHEQLITREVIIQLLQSEIPQKAKFGIEKVTKILLTKSVETDLWTALLNAPLTLTRRFAVEQVETDFDLYFSSPTFIKIAALAEWQDVGKWLRKNAKRIKVETVVKEVVYNNLLEKVLASNEERAAQNLYKNAISLFPNQVRQTPIGTVVDLIQHPLENVQLLASKILLFQKEKISDIPEQLIAQLMTSEFLAVRINGLELFNALPIEQLLQKRNILVSLAISEDPAIREKVKPILAKAAAGEPAWGIQLCTFFVPLLTQKETYEGLHTDLLDLLTEHLNESLTQIPDTQIIQLTASRYREANLLGLHLLPAVDYVQAELRDIMTLANHEMPAIRQYCYDYFQQNVGRIRYESTEALRILDSKWVESRQFGFDFFTAHYKAGDWTPELLISVCDSTRPDVQEFGKKMLTTFFQTENGADYLLKLSQHPDVSLQLFATRYLNEFATDNLPRFIELKPYFKTVLCQLYKGGATKKAVFNFLKQEGEKDVITASHVIEILNEVALTVAIGDKAKCIQVLHGLRRRFPELESVLELVAN